MSGHRKAALALHALSPEDRQHVLESLPEADQRQVQAYLGELAELGFTVDAANEALAAPVGTVEPREIVRAAAPEDIAKALQDEPASLVAALVGIEPWPWTHRFLTALPESRREAIQEASKRNFGTASERDRFLLAALAQILGRHVRAPAPGRPQFSTLRRLVAAWAR